MSLPRATGIRVGRKGEQEFPPGFYVYVGSAMNNLEKRVARHMSKSKKMRWHIDYLLQHAGLEGVKMMESNKRIECEISRAVESLADRVPMEGFGSSDCRQCRSHLYYFREDPTERIERLVSEWKNC